MPVNQLPRQLGLRFFFTWYYTQSEADMLIKKRVVMNWCSFLSYEYSFFNATVSQLITLKTLKSENKNILERPPELCPSPQAAKTMAFQTLSLTKLNILPKKVLG